MGNAASPADASVMPRFFVPRNSIAERRAVIEGEEFAHLHRVLRLKPGDAITVFDDQGWEHEGEIRALGAVRAEMAIVRSFQPLRESALAVTLAVAVTKGEKMDWVVEKATELGAHTLAPFVSLRTVPRLDERKTARREERWRKIALNATKQSGRVRVPEIKALRYFSEMIGEEPPDALKLLLWENEAEQTLRKVHEREKDVHTVILLIGPEGGFTGDEAELAERRGYHPVSLGRRILRSETAALTGLSLVQFLWGDLA